MIARCITAILFILSATASGAEYNVDREKANSVVFISDAPFEDFEGTTSHIDGFAFWPGNEFGPDIDMSRTKIHFEVELATLKTGIGMRDKDMREDYLETDKYPYAVFDGKLTSITTTGENSFRVNASGEFEVHGVKKRREFSADVTFIDDHVKIVGSFGVDLNDHDIEVPSLLFLRINELIEVELEFYLKFIK